MSRFPVDEAGVSIPVMAGRVTGGRHGTTSVSQGGTWINSSAFDSSTYVIYVYADGAFRYRLTNNSGYTAQNTDHYISATAADLGVHIPTLLDGTVYSYIGIFAVDALGTIEVSECE